jgi:K+-sensing histidine kinase KdpD
MWPVRKHALFPFAVAVAIVIATTVVRLLFMSVMGTELAFLTFVPAVMLAALYAGFWAGFFGTVLSIGFAAFFFMEPVARFKVPARGDLLGTAVFFMSAMMIVWIIENMHRALKRRLDAAAELKALNRALRLLSDCNKLLIHANQERALLTDVCSLVVDSGGTVNLF